jgi:ribosomal protein L20A (L18A)
MTGGEYEVEKILGCGLDHRRKFRFEIEWENGEHTQEIWSNVVNCELLLREFFAKEDHQTDLRHMVADDFHLIHSGDADVSIEMLKKYVLPVIWSRGKIGYVYDQGALYRVSIVKEVSVDETNRNNNVYEVRFRNFASRYNQSRAAWQILEVEDVSEEDKQKADDNCFRTDTTSDEPNTNSSESGKAKRKSNLILGEIEETKKAKKGQSKSSGSVSTEDASTPLRSQRNHRSSDSSADHSRQQADQQASIYQFLGDVHALVLNFADAIQRLQSAFGS